MPRKAAAAKAAPPMVTVATLDDAFAPAWAMGAYAVTIHHDGRKANGEPAGYTVTLSAFGPAYAADNGNRATPTLQHKGKGATMGEAFAMATDLAALLA